MLMENTNVNVHVDFVCMLTLKAKAHPSHGILIQPSLSSPQAKQVLTFPSQIKINVGK